ncbi:MAG: aminoglycoside phosphotransferase family protein [Isosphaeraceae bacterium]|nr:aminoglycoside phosphotransferase family protein [Isosphaeraceae bacterium]
MRAITPETVADYLLEMGHVPQGHAITARALGWGVSNVVVRVEIEGRAPLVLKQSREQLRTRAHWVSRLDRIWTEAAALRLLAEVLPRESVPEVVFEDRENYLFAMTCAPEEAIVWKERLLAGEADPTVAERAGVLLGAMHAHSAGHPALAGPLADTEVFDQLRIDPFYRTVARAHPDLAPAIEALIASMAGHGDVTFVHADFSPKNILVHPGGLMLVDFETAHTGDPAFDLGFFLSHLLLKAFRAAPRASAYLDLIRRFRGAYLDQAGIGPQSDRIRRAVGHAAACALARIDGKSPVDYLDEPTRAAARHFARAALRAELADWDELIGLAAREMLNSTPGQPR